MNLAMGLNFVGGLCGLLALVFAVLAQGVPVAVNQTSATNFENIFSITLHLDRSFNEDVKNVHNNGPALDLGNGKSFQYLLDICKQAVRKVRIEFSVTDTLARIERILKPIEARIAFQVAMFLEMERRNEVYTKDALILARNMKSIMDDDNYHSITSEAKSKHEEIKNKLPRSLKNIVFSNAICIKNEQFKEYLFASTDLLQPVIMYGGSQRYPYTRIPDIVSDPSIFKWRVRIIDDVQVMLYNVYYDEPLYSEDGLHEPYLESRTSRSVFTRNKNHDYAHDTRQQNHWLVEVDNDAIRFKNVFFRDEYLYASMKSKKDQDRRRVYVDPFSNTTDVTSLGGLNWVIEDCS